MHRWFDVDERFTPITTPAELDALFERSYEGAVLLFKHDPYCSVSDFAYGEIKRLGGDVPWIDVAADQPISFEVARRTGVRHESPQVIVLRDGGAAWAASHWSIKADMVRAAIEAADRASTSDPKRAKRQMR